MQSQMNEKEMRELSLKQEQIKLFAVNFKEKSETNKLNFMY